MSKVDQLIRQFGIMVGNPLESVKQFKKRTGRKVIGCFPEYVPEEIIYAAGMFPVGLWGGQVSITKSDKYLQSFACSIIRANMELGLNGHYDELSGVVIPALCDTLKCIGENWKVALPNIPYIGLVYPQNRKMEAGIRYLTAEFLRIKNELEKICGSEISEEALTESIAIYNEYRKTMRAFASIANDYPDTISPKIRHTIIKAGYFMDKAEYTLLLKELIHELNKLPKEEQDGIRVVVTGILAEPDVFLDIFDELKVTIVADDLAQESRQFRTDVPDGDDPLRQLAERWALMEGCSLLYDSQKKRGAMLIDLVKKNNADGVIICMLKFCDPEEFDYPIYKIELENEGIPMLYLEIEQQMDTIESIRTRIQGFAELIGSGYATS